MVKKKTRWLSFCGKLPKFLLFSGKGPCGRSNNAYPNVRSTILSSHLINIEIVILKRPFFVVNMWQPPPTTEVNFKTSTYSRHSTLYNLYRKITLVTININWTSTLNISHISSWLKTIFHGGDLHGMSFHISQYIYASWALVLAKACPYFKGLSKNTGQITCHKPTCNLKKNALIVREKKSTTHQIRHLSYLWIEHVIAIETVH